jgi:hypothetical protein
MADVRTLKLNLLADVDQFNKSLDKADNNTKGFSKNLQKYGKQAAAAFAVAGAAAAGFAVKIGLESVKAASDLNEEISKSQVIFGDTAKEIQAFAKTADKSLGLSNKEALTAASTFATLGKNAGLSGKDLAKFSISSTKLASDLGSFYNTSPEDAILAIGSAMRGEAEPIRKFGVLISAASLDQAALNYETRTGTELERDSKNQLTESSKVLARYQAIIDQTSDAQGDFSRTSEGLAAQQKILDAQLANLKTTMGQNLLPVMLEVVEQANFMAKAFGGDDAEGLSERARELAGNFDGEGSGGYNLALALKNAADAFTALFDALDDPSADGANSTLQNFADGINGIASAMRFLGDAYDFAKPVLKYIGGVNFARTAFQSWQNRLNPDDPAKAAGGSVMAGKAYTVGEFGPETFVPNGSGSIRPNGGLGGGVTIIMNGVIDGESARRSIEKLLQDSSRRTGAVNLVGATL